jgi:uncharacterized protein (DUF2249 family)
MQTVSETRAASQAINATIDVRLIPPDQRHAIVFQHFEALPVGGWIDLLADHEPLPLKGQFQAQWPGQFDWQTLEAGPALWCVRLSRKPAGKACCGCCS